MNKMTEAQKVKLQKVWDKRLKLYHKANKIQRDAEMRYTEADRLIAEAEKLTEQQEKCCKLSYEGNKLWLEAIVAYANSLDDPNSIRYRWDYPDCIVDGIRFEWK